MSILLKRISDLEKENEMTKDEKLALLKLPLDEKIKRTITV